MLFRKVLVYAIMMNMISTLNYSDALDKTLKFFNSMRSGNLSQETTEDFVLSSGVNDGADDVTDYAISDLSGGWFVNGGNVKFNFPMASTVTVMALAGLEHKKNLQDYS